MTLSEIHALVMFQTNNDSDDLGDYLPHIDEYINDGYDQICVLWDNQHVPSDNYPALARDKDEPELPEWMHRYIADWATWLIYRNGNPSKQQRGQAFWSNFQRLLTKLADCGGKAGFNDDGSQKKYKYFINIPK